MSVSEGLKVYITDAQRRKFDLLKQCNIEPLEVISFSNSKEQDLFCKAHEIFALIVDKTQITEELIERLSNCKIIVRMGVGFDNVDLDAARRMNIDVCNIPDFCMEEVADHALAMMLSFVRNIPHYNRIFDDKLDDWGPFVNSPFRQKRFSKMTVGVIGLGRIGSSVVGRLKGFNCNILYYDPYRPRGGDKVFNIVEERKLEDLLNESDIVTIHVPLTEDTHHMVNSEFLMNMKKGSVLINTSRGNIINTEALIEALSNNQILGAGIDVFEEEPPKNQFTLLNFHDKHPSRLLLSPHCAFYSVESDIELQNKAIEEIMRVKDGYKPLNKVNE